jgi:hypothetical protein
MSKSRKRRNRELAEKLISLGYQFYPASMGLYPEERAVEDKFGNSAELKVAVDKRRRKNLGISHGSCYGWEIYPTKKLQQILDKLQPFPDLDVHKETTIRMPKSNVEIPLRWFEDGGWSKHFYSRAEVRSWLNSMNPYFVELQDLMVAKSLKS